MRKQYFRLESFNIMSTLFASISLSVSMAKFQQIEIWPILSTGGSLFSHYFFHEEGPRLFANYPVNILWCVFMPIEIICCTWNQHDQWCYVFFVHLPYWSSLICWLGNSSLVGFDVIFLWQALLFLILN